MGWHKRCLDCKCLKRPPKCAEVPPSTLSSKGSRGHPDCEDCLSGYCLWLQSPELGRSFALRSVETVFVDELARYLLQSKNHASKMGFLSEKAKFMAERQGSKVILISVVEQHLVKCVCFELCSELWCENRSAQTRKYPRPGPGASGQPSRFSKICASR